MYICFSNNNSLIGTKMCKVSYNLEKKTVHAQYLYLLSRACNRSALATTLHMHIWTDKCQKFCYDHIQIFNPLAYLSVWYYYSKILEPVSCDVIIQYSAHYYGYFIFFKINSSHHNHGVNFKSFP